MDTDGSGMILKRTLAETRAALAKRRAQEQQLVRGARARLAARRRKIGS